MYDLVCGSSATDSADERLNRWDGYYGMDAFVGSVVQSKLAVSTKLSRQCRHYLGCRQSDGFLVSEHVVLYPNRGYALCRGQRINGQI
jgi:hypothetical protein